MKKDGVTDYAVTAFALYARYDRRNEAELREYIYSRELLKYDRPEIAIRRAEAAVAEKNALFADIAAVEKTLTLLSRCGDPDRLKAVEAVYISKSGNSRRNVAMRVRAISREIPVAERTVYRWLKEARTIFAEFRGLYNETMFFG